MVAPLLELSKFWLFLSLKHKLRGQNFKIDAQLIQKTQPMLGRIPKEFETTIKRMGMEVNLAENGQYFEKENVK